MRMRYMRSDTDACILIYFDNNAEKRGWLDNLRLAIEAGTLDDKDTLECGYGMINTISRRCELDDDNNLVSALFPEEITGLFPLYFTVMANLGAMSASMRDQIKEYELLLNLIAGSSQAMNNKILSQDKLIKTQIEVVEAMKKRIQQLEAVEAFHNLISLPPTKLC